MLVLSQYSAAQILCDNPADTSSRKNKLQYTYLPSSPCNLVSLALLNNNGIFHDNEHETLYQVQTKRVLTQAKRWKNSYLLRPLSLSDAAVQLLKIDDETYEWRPQVFRMLSPNTRLITTWHK